MLPKSKPEDLLKVLELRFVKNMARHSDLELREVLARLEAAPERLRSLAEMEQTGGQPDVIGRDAKWGEIDFADA